VSDGQSETAEYLSTSGSLSLRVQVDGREGTMSAGTWNIAVEQGADWAATVTWEADGDPVDLTGYSAAMQVRKSPGSVAALLELTDAAGLTLGGAAGTIEITITSAQLSAIEAGDWQYDLELTSASGVVTRVLQGRFVVDAEVTR
jgi:hypothetical protein